MLIFGINCAGKTSLQKAVGLCAIMAQAGLFVPAKSCTLSPYKAIYTRITGNDNLFKGLSSFALEMLELKAILKRASQYTLVIGDEICRGTEHVSGNALVATSIINLSKLESSFIFATHLHEIAKLERVKSLKNVKAFHLSVSYDNKLDTLVYDRQLKEGSGDEIYGITVAKYIIRDADFINTALEIKNELTQDYGSLVSGKTSKYNSELFIHECNVCHKKNTKGAVSNLETHHINFQSNCENGFVKDKPYLKMNDKANLIVLCSECHDKIHNGTLHIDGQIMTSDGVKPHAKVNKQLKKN
jgi:DNA mismatch repair protein MutS